MKLYVLIGVMITLSKQGIVYEYHSILDDKNNLHYTEKKEGQEQTSGVKEVDDITKLKEYREWYGDKWRGEELEEEKKRKKEEKKEKKKEEKKKDCDKKECFRFP